MLHPITFSRYAQGDVVVDKMRVPKVLDYTKNRDAGLLNMGKTVQLLTMKFRVTPARSIRSYTSLKVEDTYVDEAL